MIVDGKWLFDNAHTKVAELGESGKIVDLQRRICVHMELNISKR